MFHRPLCAVRQGMTPVLYPSAPPCLHFALESGDVDDVIKQSRTETGLIRHNVPLNERYRRREPLRAFMHRQEGSNAMSSSMLAGLCEWNARHVMPSSTHHIIQPVLP